MEEVAQWAPAEERGLLREKTRAVRRHPIAGLWIEILDTWEHPEGDR